MRGLLKGCTRIALLVAIAVAAFAQVAGAQTLATYQLGAGWATFGLALPQGAAATGVVVGALQTQTDVKTRWADGSIRFAVVTASVPAAGTYAVTAGPAAAGTSMPAVPNASVRLAIGATTYTAVLPPVSSDLWLSGPLATEWRGVVAPQSSSGAVHPFLRVIFDTRVYNDGQARLDVTVENLLDVAGATSVTYNVDVVNEGVALFSKASVAHGWLTRWRKTFNITGLTPAAMTPDFEPTFAAKALPRYESTIVNNIESPAGLTYDILGSGAVNPYMPNAGGRAELAPYPDWTARYIVHKNATQRQLVLANGDLAGSWPIHIREADGRLVSIDERANFWLDSRCTNDGVSCPRGNLGATGTLVPDSAHQPSLAFVPYLVTGDRYYADEMAFWANYNLIEVWPVERAGGGTNPALGLHYYSQVRGYAWSLRNMGDAALYLPDNHPSKPYFVAKVNNNLKWGDDYASGLVTTGFYAQPLSPIGASFYYNDLGQAKIAIWEHNYVAWSLDHLISQGFGLGTKLRDRLVDFQLKLFTSTPNFDRNCAAPYRPTIGNIGALYTSIDQFSVAACADNRPFPSYYGIDARMILIIAERLGRAGAGSAYDFLMAQVATDGSTMVNDVNQRAGWAVARGGAPAVPLPPPAPDTTAPVISATQASAITGNSATITWSTNEGADSQVEFGQTTGYGSISILDAALGITHAVPISGLLPSTPYHYRVKSRDAAGNLSVSADFTFSTTAPVTTLQLTFDDLVGSQQALVGQYPAGVADWGSTQWWHSGPFGAFTTKSISFNGAANPGITSATFTLLAGHRLVQLDAYNGGAASTTLTLKCLGQPNKQVAIAAGQIATVVTGWTSSCASVTISNTNGWDTNFDNLVLDASAPLDTTAPSITGVTPTGLTTDGATITWTTSEPADSRVEYGATSAYGSQTPLDGTLVMAHAMVLVGLTPGTTYHFRVKGSDAAGNLAASADFTFTTAADTTAPVISAVQASGVTATEATVTWQTNEAADSQVAYGPAIAYGSSTPLDIRMLTAHSVTLTGLTGNTLYHYQVTSKDAAGNPVTAGDFSFTTQNPVTPPSPPTNLHIVTQ